MEHYTQHEVGTRNPMSLIEGETHTPNKKRSLNPYVIGFLLFSASLLTFATFQIGHKSANNENDDTFLPDYDKLPRTTFVHLFEWKWSDIEKECIEYLGPNGFSAVQVSPPNEHVDHTKLKDVSPDAANYDPWWARYQPVSYIINSRSGNREEFKKMIDTCASVNVDIYVDLILNHMARDQVGYGVSGTYFNSETLEYSIYSASDFNSCEPEGIQGSDYANNADRVRRCRLVDLPDLNHDSVYVKQRLTDFVQDLVNLGVKGFRLDAGKHMYPKDINDIMNPVQGEFYIFSEVYDFGSEAVSVNEYTPYHDVTEFRYEVTIASKFTEFGQTLASLRGIGEGFGYVNSNNAVVFTDNHDSQRGSGKLLYRKGRTYDLANVFVLAYPYGYPKIMSSYYFNDGEFSRGPPSDSQGNTNDVFNGDGSLNCREGEWVCEHRRRPMSNMVKFKNFMAQEAANDVQHWWDNGFQAIAFARSAEGESVGFVIINKEDFPITNRWYTGLPNIEYCDTLDGDWGLCGPECGECDGRRVKVQDGFLETTVEPMSALAIHTGATIV